MISCHEGLTEMLSGNCPGVPKFFWHSRQGSKSGLRSVDELLGAVLARDPLASCSSQGSSVFVRYAHESFPSIRHCGRLPRGYDLASIANKDG